MRRLLACNGVSPGRGCAIRRGRSSRLRKRRQSSLCEQLRKTTTPCCLAMSLTAAVSKAPPPRAITTDLSDLSSCRSRSTSMRRKTRSPLFAKTFEIFCRVCLSITASRSTNRYLNLTASVRPIVDFPEPEKPIRNMCFWSLIFVRPKANSDREIPARRQACIRLPTPSTAQVILRPEPRA